MFQVWGILSTIHALAVIVSLAFAPMQIVHWANALSAGFIMTIAVAIGARSSRDLNKWHLWLLAAALYAVVVALYWHRARG